MNREFIYKMLDLCMIGERGSEVMGRVQRQEVKEKKKKKKKKKSGQSKKRGRSRWR